MKTRIAWTSVDSFRDATSIRFIFHSIKLQRQSRKCPGGIQCSSFSLKNYNSPQLKNYDYVVTYWASTCKYLRSLQAYWPTKKAFFTASQKTQSYSRLIVNNPTSRTGRPATCHWEHNDRKITPLPSYRSHPETILATQTEIIFSFPLFIFTLSSCFISSPWNEGPLS